MSPKPRTASSAPRGATGARPAAKRRLVPALFEPVDIAFLVFFRIVFGLVMVPHILIYFVDDHIREFYIAPKFHFTFYGFDWVRPAGEAMYPLFIALGVLSVCVAAGLFYRVSTVLLCLGLAYVFLLDRVRYFNHHYLFCLISFAMIFLPAHRAGSIDAWLRPRIASGTTPAWTLWLVRLHVALPYFFGGVAKFDADWLQAIPMQIVLEYPRRELLRHPAFPKTLASYLLSYGGLLFDLLIVPALLWKRTRAWALVLAIGFHLTNAWLFEIELFPWFMILATLVFLPPSWPRKVGFAWLPKPESRPAAEASGSLSTGQKVTACLLAAYVAVHVLLPFRHWLYPGNANWTNEGQRFAWRMMLHHKVGTVRFLATDRATGQTTTVSAGNYLTPTQFYFMRYDPDLIHQFAIYLANAIRETEGREVDIRVESIVSMNRRPVQWMIDPKVVLSSEPRGWRSGSWLVPLGEGLIGPNDLPPGALEGALPAPAAGAPGSSAGGPGSSAGGPGSPMGGPAPGR